MNIKKKIKAIITICIILTIISTNAVVEASPSATQTENTSTTYVNFPKAGNKIYWAKGIKPPKMPEIAESDNIGNDGFEGNFVEYNATNGFKSWVAPYPKNGNCGWYDFNKVSKNDDGSHSTNDNSCFAASASNILEWWLYNNKDNINKYLNKIKMDNFYIQNEQYFQRIKNELSYFMDFDRISQKTSKIFNDLSKGDNSIYRKLRPTISLDTGGWVTLMVDSFINGYPSRNGTESDLMNNVNKFNKGNANLGYFYPVFKKDILSELQFYNGNYNSLTYQLKEKLTTGHGVSISVGIFGTSAHALTVWGAEYSPDEKLIAVYLTDSDDGSTSYNITGTNSLIAMERRFIYNDNNVAKMTTQLWNGQGTAPGSRIENAIYVSLGADSYWNAFFNDSQATILKTISIEDVYIENRVYQIGKKDVTINNVTFNDDVILQMGNNKDYTATAEMTDDNAGTNKSVTITVKLNDSAKSKYKLDSETFTKTVNISKANPNIGEVTYKGGNLYTNTNVKDVVLNRTNEAISGKLSLTNDKFVVGKNNYTWTFKPDNKNFEELTGNIDLTVLPTNIASENKDKEENQTTPNLTATSCTNEQNNDGKIQGLNISKTYEYLKSDNEPSDWSMANEVNSSTEITGLKSGTYYVREKETATHKASKAIKLTIKKYKITTYSLKYIAGEGGTIAPQVATQIVAKNANGAPVKATPKANYKFLKWSDNKTDNPRTDTNIQKDITVTAIFSKIASVNNGSNNSSSSGGSNSSSDSSSSGGSSSSGSSSNGGSNSSSGGSSSGGSLSSGDSSETKPEKKDNEIKNDDSKNKENELEKEKLEKEKLEKEKLEKINKELKIKYPKNIVVGKKVYLDTKKSDWYSKSVKFAVENNLMVGTSETTFSPKLDTTRAMVATILFRLSKEEKVLSKNKFKDVENGKWYHDSIIWAKEKGIVKGYDENTFAPNDKLTREQLITIMYRYAKLKGYNTKNVANLEKYTDTDKISNFATTPIKWAVANGIIKGTSDSTLSSKENTTRAMVAQIFMNFINKFEENK